jgi:hypothetical protein
MKYLKRILGLPFVLIINFIGFFFHLFTLSKCFILYGGESRVFQKKTSEKTIDDICELLEKLQSKNDIK